MRKHTNIPISDSNNIFVGLDDSFIEDPVREVSEVVSLKFGSKWSKYSYQPIFCSPEDEVHIGSAGRVKVTGVLNFEKAVRVYYADSSFVFV